MNDYLAWGLIVLLGSWLIPGLVIGILIRRRTLPRVAVTRRPCWSDAPEWARYLMQDSSGGWMWLERNPKNGGVAAGRHLPAVVYETYRLERRPHGE